MREYKVTERQQQGLVIIRSDRVKPSKPFIPDKYNDHMELNKINRKSTLQRHYCNSELGDLVKRR